MAKVWITQYATAGVDARGHDVQMPQLPALKTDVLDISGGTSVLMPAAFDDRCSIVAVSADAAFHARSTVFANPTAATTSSKRIPANGIVYWTIAAGNPAGLALAVILSA